MRVLILTLCCAAGAALAQTTTPQARTPDAPLATVPDARVPSVPTAPSRPATAATPGEAAAAPGDAAPAPALARSAPSALAIDPKGEGWGTPVVPQVGTGFENILNSGAPVGRSRVPRKVCPPGLESRDGVCVAPPSQILR